jgi:hypothetical protein
MPMTLSGDGTITGLAAGGLPDASITAADLATGAARANFGAGAVLQVVSTTKTDTFSSSSGSWNDVTGLSVSITPTSSTSRIFVMYSLMTGVTGSQFPMMRLVRNSTAISVGDASGVRQQVSSVAWSSGANNVTMMQSMNFLDSPATTSSTTYKLQTIATASETVFVNRNARDDNGSYEPRAVSTITVMEIAA